MEVTGSSPVGSTNFEQFRRVGTQVRGEPQAAARETFETSKWRPGGDRQGFSTSGWRGRYGTRVLVCALVVVVLAGGAYYSSRLSESAPKTVYSTSLDEAVNEARTPLLVNINTADVKELDELPGVGPSTAKNIVEHRRHGGSFKRVEDLEDVKGIGPKTLEKIKPFATV